MTRGQPSTRRTTGASRCAASIACGLVVGLAAATGARAQQVASLGSDPGDEPVFSAASPLGSIDYFAGRGLRVGDTGLTIGGFTTLEVDREEGKPAEIALDSINFLVSYQPVERLQIFADLEVDGLLAIDTSDANVDSSPDFTAERLYADLSASDALNLRIGKFQTPVGVWNLVPAEPFVWTAEGPVTIENGFDEFQTGLALSGSFFPGSNTLSYWVYGQVVPAFDPASDEDPADRSVGGRLEYGSADAGWSLGGSFLASVKDGDWSQLGGLDAQLRIGALELTGEALVQRGDIPDRDLWGAYLQGVYHLESLWNPLHGVYAVARYEHFDSDDSGGANLVDLGGAWLPVPWLNIKVDYRFSDRETSVVRRGLSASLSVLF